MYNRCYCECLLVNLCSVARSGGRGWHLFLSCHLSFFYSFICRLPCGWSVTHNSTPLHPLLSFLCPFSSRFLNGIVPSVPPDPRKRWSLARSESTFEITVVGSCKKGKSISKSASAPEIPSTRRTEESRALDGPPRWDSLKSYIHGPFNSWMNYTILEESAAILFFFFLVRDPPIVELSRVFVLSETDRPNVRHVQLYHLPPLVSSAESCIQV